METHHPHKKSFFETYQTFIALVICGALIAGGIIVARLIPSESSDQQPQETRTSVRKNILDQAGSLNLNKKELAACIDSDTHTKTIDDAVALAQSSGVSGTPTFFIIKRTLDQDGTVLRQKQWSVLGARTQSVFETSIRTELSPSDQPPVTGEPITFTEQDHWIGPRDASIVIVEYADIDCFYCKQAQPTIDALLKENPGYAFVYRHSPIADLHPFAPYKAIATECAQDLGGDTAFWGMLKALSQ